MLEKYYDKNIEPFSTASFTKAQLRLNFMYTLSEPRYKFYIPSDTHYKFAAGHYYFI